MTDSTTPPPVDSRNDSKRRVKGPALLALTLSVVAGVGPLTQSFEGFSGRAYRDPAGYLTQCYGDRVVDPAVIYSKSQCAVKLRARMARDYAPVLVRGFPDLANPENHLAYGALLDTAYNAGPGAVLKSAAVADMRKGRWTVGCRAITGWRVTARGITYSGLQRRRSAETAYCLTGKIAA